MSELLTSKEVGELLGVSYTTVSRITLRGELSYYLIGKTRKFSEEAVREYLERQKVSAKPPARSVPQPVPKVHHTQTPAKRGPGRPLRQALPEYYPGMKVV